MDTLTIATWNVNSIKVRLGHLLDWLGERAPDVVCLQEIKCVDEAFPTADVEAAGYQVLVHGQKTYNGVALLSRHPVEETARGLPGNEDDDQARYIEGLVQPEGARPVVVGGLYLPNGNPAPGPKYDYKRRWMAHLQGRAKALLADETPFVLAGDYNVIPRPEDVHDPAAWADDALFRPDTRSTYRTLLYRGLTDAFEACNTQAGHYSFWDYQAGAWPRNHGIRIDHLLVSPQLGDRLEAAGIDKDMRDREKPSDHVPVWARFAA